MVCERVQMPGGGFAIACGVRRKAKRCACGSGLPATRLCDWKVPGGTCDADLCGGCTHIPAPDKDLCPAHAAEWQARLARRTA
jgi:hypothetical protein